MVSMWLPARLQASPLRGLLPGMGIALMHQGLLMGMKGSGAFRKPVIQTLGGRLTLGNLYVIDSINIKNRWCNDTSDPRGCLCKLSNATVSMIDENDIVVATASALNTCSVLNVHPNLPPPCDSYCLPNARKVKIEQTSTGQPIQIFQLHVSSSGIDVAQGKNATQSSTWVAKWNGKSFNASNAVDGKPMTYSRTNDDSNAWLEVDLGGNFAVGSLDILNRWCKDLTDPENCLCKLSGATILLIDDSGDETTSISIGDTCGKAHLEYVLDPSPEFCPVSEGSNTMDFSPSRQLIRQPSHNRVLRKRPTKC